MRRLLIRLWNDEAGFILSAELVLIGTIAVLSLVVGLSALSSAVNHEILDCAAAFGALDSGGRYGDDGNGHGRHGGGHGDDDPDFAGWAAP
ncbi:MAG: branched-chain amino acid aminotransferase [Planctomycetales bacterium]